MVERLETAGLQFVGKDETGRRMEILELPGHPYYVGVQFHPEFKSRPGKPSAVFLGLILAASGQMDSYISGGHGLSIRNPTPPTLGQADSASSQDIGLSERLEKL
jgi:CTP synthase